MIDIYSWPTPNGHKVHIMLEACGLQLGRDWRAHPVNIGAGEQFAPDFLKVSPNNKIPALVDSDGPDGRPISLFESGAILIYLAAKTGKLMPKGEREKYQVLQWLMFQMAGVGPMLGQAHHFRIYALDKIPYAYDRYTKEAKRLYGVMDRQLQHHPHIAGKSLSVADVAIYPWVRSWENQGIDWADHPHLKTWFDRLNARPAFQRGVAVLADLRKPLTDEQARRTLFGQDQFAQR